MHLIRIESKRILQNSKEHLALKILFNCKRKDFLSQLPCFKSCEAKLSFKTIENN